MKYSVELQFPHQKLAIINAYLNAEFEGKYQGEDNIITNSVFFPDGRVMDIECCGSRDESSWTEAVLFAPAADGVGLQEVRCSEPGESYEGEWELKDKDTVYRVVVVDGGDIPECRIRLLDESDFAHITLHELEAVMVHTGLTIRAIPRMTTCIYEASHANEYPSGRVMYLGEYNREMLVVDKIPDFAGKFIAECVVADDAAIHFNAYDTFDSLADVLQAVAEHSICVGISEE